MSTPITDHDYDQLLRTAIDSGLSEADIAVVSVVMSQSLDTLREESAPPDRAFTAGVLVGLTLGMEDRKLGEVFVRTILNAMSSDDSATGLRLLAGMGPEVHHLWQLMRQGGVQGEMDGSERLP